MTWVRAHRTLIIFICTGIGIILSVLLVHFGLPAILGALGFSATGPVAGNVQLSRTTLVHVLTRTEQVAPLPPYSHLLAASLPAPRLRWHNPSGWEGPFRLLGIFSQCLSARSGDGCLLDETTTVIIDFEKGGDVFLVFLSVLHE